MNTKLLVALLAVTISAQLRADTLLWTYTLPSPETGIDRRTIAINSPENEAFDGTGGSAYIVGESGASVASAQSVVWLDSRGRLRYFARFQDAPNQTSRISLQRLSRSDLRIWVRTTDSGSVTQFLRRVRSTSRGIVVTDTPIAGNDLIAFSRSSNDPLGYFTFHSVGNLLTEIKRFRY